MSTKERIAWRDIKAGDRWRCADERGPLNTALTSASPRSEDSRYESKTEVRGSFGTDIKPGDTTVVVYR